MKHFIQSWGSYEHDTIVFVGADLKYILNTLERYKLHKYAEMAAGDKQMITDALKMPAFVYHAAPYAFLWLEDWKNDWEHLDTLAHEVHHLINFILVEDRNFKGEIEGQAYQFCYLFKKIRIKLNKIQYDGRRKEKRRQTERRQKQRKRPKAKKVRHSKGN